MTDANPKALTLYERESLLFQDPMLIHKITRHVSSGGTVIDLAALWQVDYSTIMRWIRSDDSRKQQYNESLVDREEWTYERILKELRTIGTVDIRTLYNNEGGLLPVDQWPDGAAAAVAGVDVFEEYTGSGTDRVHEGTVRKLKMVDKLKALELAGKTQRMFTDRVEQTTILKLEDILAGSYEAIKPVTEASYKPASTELLRDEHDKENSSSISNDQASDSDRRDNPGSEEVQSLYKPHKGIDG